MSTRGNRRVKKKDAGKRPDIRRDPMRSKGLERYSKEWLLACKNQRVDVYWPLDEQFYSGKVMDVRFNRKDGKTVWVHYEDGDKEWLDLRKETYHFKRTEEEDDEDEDEDGQEGDESGQDSEIDDSDSKNNGSTSRGRHSGSSRNLKRKRSEDSNDETEAPPKKRTRGTRGRPKGRKRATAEDDSESDSEMKQPASTNLRGSNSGHNSKSRNSSRNHGSMTNGNSTKKHSTTNMNKPVSSSLGKHDNTLLVSDAVSNQVPSMFTPHDQSLSNSVSNPLAAAPLSNTPNIPTPNGLSMAGSDLAARVGDGGPRPLLQERAEPWIDKHVTVVDDNQSRHDAVIIDYRPAGSAIQYQVQYDESEETWWVDEHQVQEQESTESPKGAKNAYVLALDNNQWFKGVVEDILVGVKGPIFRIAFPQFESSPFMYFPDRRVREYKQEDANMQMC